MKRKLLPAFLALAVVGTLGLAPISVQAASLDDIELQLQNKGIVFTGTVTSMEELKQKLEEMGIDCSNPNWDIIIPGLPVPPESPELPDGSHPELPDGSQPEKPELPDDNQPENPELPDNDQENADFIQQVVNLVNRERAKAGLSPVTAHSTVQAAAQIRAKEIESSFAHTRPDGSPFTTALTQQGVSYRGAGENIAWGQKTPEQVMDGWMNSEGHRANILSKGFTAIGVGYYQNASGTNYWTQLFTY